jgi:DNA-binding ferritin-like protein
MLSIISDAISITSGILSNYFAGAANYSHNNVPILFSLGEAIAAFGLIFVVFQLKNESWEIVLKIRGRWQSKIFWCFGGAGLFFIAVAAWLRQSPPNITHTLFNYPFTYELIGFLCFVASPSSLYILATKKKGLFNQKRAKKFYTVMLSEIARPKNASVEACVNIIGANLDEITEALKNSRFIRGHNNDNSPLKKEEIYASYAEAITSVILSDEKVARYIATGRLDFLLGFLADLKKNNITLYHTRFGLEKILESLFQEKNSYLYNQLDCRGVSLATNVFEIIFSDPYFITHLEVFSSAHQFGSFYQLNEKYLTVYFKALEYALKGFWKNNCPYDMGQEIGRVFKQIHDYSQSLAYATRQKDKIKEALSRLQKIEFFLGHTYIWAYRDALKNNLVSDYEKEATKTDDYITSVNYAYADCVYHFIESLAIAKEEFDDQIRTIAIGATRETIDVTSISGSDITKIQEALTKLIWEKINGKFSSNERGYSPVVLKVYLEMIGLKVGDGTSVAAQEREKLIKFLYTSIKPKILNNETMRDRKTSFEKAILPICVIFNRVTGNFEYILNGGDRQIMEQSVPDLKTTDI